MRTDDINQPDPNQKTWDAAHACSVGQLNKLILSMGYRKQYRRPCGKIDDMLEMLLHARQRKLNTAFEWTPENIEKFLALDKRMIECFEKLRAEAKPLLAEFKARIDSKDAFLEDYELDAKVTSFMLIPDKEGELYEPDSGIERVLMDWIPKHVLSFPCREIDDNLYLDKKRNWNIDLGFNRKLDEYYISYAMHELHSHTFLSFPDILRINYLSAELIVRRQHFVETITLETDEIKTDQAND